MKRDIFAIDSNTLKLSLDCIDWAIESFFKEFKQTLQLADFVGYNEKAVKWQVWIGLLAHLLLRFLKHVSKWGLSFSHQ